METKPLLRRTAAVLAGLALFGSLSGVGQASAAPEAAVNPVIEGHVTVPASGQSSCLGYDGTFKPGTGLYLVNWATAGRECWGISPGGGIWHTWPNAGGWYPMPGNGRADHVIAPQFLEWTADGSRRVKVWVASSDTFWCQLYYRPRGWQGFWFQCT